MRVREINEEERTLTFLVSVTTVNLYALNKDQAPNWQAKVNSKVCTRNINLRLDAGADEP